MGPLDNILRPIASAAGGDSGRRELWWGLMVEYGPLVLLLAAALVGMIVAYCQKARPTQLQLVEGAWRYAPTPASYRGDHNTNTISAVICMGDHNTLSPSLSCSKSV